MSKFKIILMGLITLSINSFSQINQLGTFLANGPEDAKLLSQAYISPYANALGANLSAGWYNTAKPHTLGGFDLTVTWQSSIIPQAERVFNPQELGISGTSSANSSPTAAGKSETGANISYPDVDGKPNYDLPKGTGFPLVSTPMISLGVGLVWGTEIKGRYMPNMKLGESGKIGLWGVGVKHDLTQYLGIAEKLPLLNISVFGGYTRLNSGFIMDIQPKDIGSSATGSFDDQQMNIIASSFTGNLLISVDLPIVVFYGGAGFSSTATNLALTGTFPTYSESLEDPLDITIESRDGSVTNPRLNGGVRFKLGLLTLHADYTRAKYDIITAGIGLSFR